jgi:hypothetical protein
MPSPPTAVLLLAVIASSGCRVAADSGDAGGSDGAGGGDAADRADKAETADGDSGGPPAGVCDLLLQNCPDRRQTCYPDATLSGATRCLFPGSGGPLAPCLLHEECDRRSICVDTNGDGFTLCATLCDPGAMPNGCQGVAACHSLANYRAGTCDP